ncbi:MAG: glutamate transporter permease [Massilia sp.]|nr:glutamate transporter permease [Massilia sp.]
MNYHWNWHIFGEMSPDGVHTYFDTLAAGTAWTLATALSAWLIALVLGLVVGTARTLSNRSIVAVASAYVELFRNIPLLVQMFLWYFVMPEVLPARAGAWLKSMPNTAFITAVLSLAFFTSARVAVQVSAGIEALPRGLTLAATALGLTGAQAYRFIRLPIALRLILPPLTSEFLNIIKNSSVALTIGLVELTASARAIQEFSFQVFEAFSAATVIYLVINIVVAFLMQRLEKKVAVPGYIGATAKR